MSMNLTQVLCWNEWCFSSSSGCFISPSVETCIKSADDVFLGLANWTNVRKEGINVFVFGNLRNYFEKETHPIDNDFLIINLLMPLYRCTSTNVLQNWLKEDVVNSVNPFCWHLQMARQIVFTDSGFWKYSWAHLVMSMTESCRWVMQGLKTTVIQQRPSALSLTHRDFSSFSESFDDVMHCRLWNLQSLCNLTLRNVVFKNLFTHSSTDWWASAELYFWETLPL